MDSGITYTVHDATPSEPDATGGGWIEFSRPTRTYRSPSGDRAARVRLTVDDGRLTITAPHLYPRYSLRPTTTPPPDSDGNLRIARLGEDNQTQIDLIMAADGVVTASLRMETIPRPFTRRDIVSLADMFVEGIELLDMIIRQHGLLIPGPETPDH